MATETAASITASVTRYLCGTLVEFVGDAVNELEINEAAAASAHQELAKWNNKDYSPNNLERGTVSYPLATSPIKIISKVTRGR